MRDLQRVRHDVFEPQFGRHGRRQGGVVDLVQTVAHFGELVGEGRLKFRDARVGLRDLAPDEGEEVLKAAQIALVEAHPPGLKTGLAHLALQLVAKRAKRFADLRNPVARTGRVRAVLHGRRQFPAGRLQLRQNRLELRERLCKSLYVRFRMRRHGTVDGIGDCAIEGVEDVRGCDAPLDMDDGVLRRLEHALGAVHVPVAASADGVVCGEVRALAGAGLHVRTDADDGHLLDDGIFLDLRIHLHPGLFLNDRVLLSRWHLHVHMEVRHGVAARNVDSREWHG